MYHITSPALTTTNQPAPFCPRNLHVNTMVGCGCQTRAQRTAPTRCYYSVRPETPRKLHVVGGIQMNHMYFELHCTNDSVTQTYFFSDADCTLCGDAISIPSSSNKNIFRRDFSDVHRVCTTIARSILHGESTPLRALLHPTPNILLEQQESINNTWYEVL